MEQNKNITLEASRVIAYRPELAMHLGYDTDAAIILQQLYHWQKYAKRKDGFFYKTAEELEQETAIKKRSVHRIREKLEKLGFIEVKKEMANGSATYHYRVLISIGTVITSSSDNLTLPSDKTALSITKNTHDIIIVDFAQGYASMSEVHKLYVSWLIGMVIGNRKWLATANADRRSLLETAAKQTKLTPKRFQKLSVRISDLGFEACRKAILAIGNSAWHQGENDNKWKASLEWLFHSTERTEEWSNKK